MLCRLAECFKEDDKKGLITFWNIFKEKDAFDALINVLQLNEREKANWLASYTYQLTDTYNLMARIKHNANYYIRGSTINLAVLRNKADKVAKQLCQRIFNVHLTEPEKELSLKYLVNYHEKEGLVILQKKLKGSLHKLSMPIPSLFDKEDYQSRLDALDNQTIQIKNGDIKGQNDLRYLLIQLYRGLTEILLTIRTDIKNTFLYEEGIDHLKVLLKQNVLLLGQRERQNKIALCDHALDEWHQALSSALDVPKKTLLEQRNNYDLKRKKEIQDLQAVIQGSLNKLEEKGKARREEALQDLSIFLLSRQGFWEQIFRLISPTYRHCMTELNRILKENEMSALKKMDAIITTIEASRKKGICIVQHRFSALYGAGSMVFFAPEKNRPHSSLLAMASPAFASI